MTLKALSDYIFSSKYAQNREDLGRRETLAESGKRMIDMHRRRYAGMGVESYIDEAEKAFNDGLILGSQRALQYGGFCIERHNEKLYNCTVSYCDRPRFFQEAVYLLLCGCGVGFSVQHHHVAKLPKIAKPKGNGSTKTFVIPDTIEGWGDAFGVLMSSYFQGDDVPFPKYQGFAVDFDYSEIRDEGSLIKSSGCKAPGPAPLKRALEKARAVIEAVLEMGLDRLRSIDAYDIAMHGSDAVLSGGVRRSASICIFSADDELMLNAKVGNWLATNPQRGRSNNSVLLLRKETSREQFQDILDRAKEWGEPGFFWADSTEIMPNPCVEIGMWPVWEGVTGWQFCNLTEQNMTKVTTPELFARSARAAAILGTLQAGYTDFSYLGEVSQKITEREALLGVSMTGMMDSPDIAFDPDLQSEMAQLILDVNAELAPKIGVNLTARATCVKPSGTASCLLMSSSGIHAHHAKRAIRHVQANRNEAPLQWFEKHNPRAVELSSWNPNGTDKIISFLIEAKEDALTKKDLTALDLLDKVRSTKINWVDAGRVPERCAQPWLSHNVSNTIDVDVDEWDEVSDYIYENRDHFAGISLLSKSGDLDYAQAPFVEVLTAEEIIEKYGVGAILASGLIVDGNHCFRDLWKACDYALGISEKTAEEECLTAEMNLESCNLDLQENPDNLFFQKISESQLEEVIKRRVRVDWVRRAKQFADRYFKGDVREMTRCLKSVHYCKKWEDIQREIIDVDYTKMPYTKGNDHLAQTVACAGGSCEVIM